MVHQHFMLVRRSPSQRISCWARNPGRLDEVPERHGDARSASRAERIRELSSQYGLEVDPDAYVRDLPVGAQQRVEIVKALYRAATS